MVIFLTDLQAESIIALYSVLCKISCVNYVIYVVKAVTHVLKCLLPDADRVAD